MVLFFVLFFPQRYHNLSADFLSSEEIVYSLLWRLPACILILLLYNKPLPIKPKKDVFVTAITLPILCLIGFLVSLAAALTDFFSTIEGIPSPSDLIQWVAAILLSFGTGFLEEAFFRLYLPWRLLEMRQFPNNPPGSQLLFNAYATSAIIFALCHIGSGPWAITNALLAAAVLSIAYIKSSSFMGIALAHGLYNIFVFFMTGL